MRITWRDAITTISMGSAIVVERAYFHNWDWPLVSSMNWVLVGLAALGLLAILAGISFDKFASEAWNFIAAIWALATVAVAGLGMAYEVSDYVVIMMLNVVGVWIVSVAYHFIEQGNTHQLHTTM